MRFGFGGARLPNASLAHLGPNNGLEYQICQDGRNDKSMKRLVSKADASWDTLYMNQERY